MKKPIESFDIEELEKKANKYGAKFRMFTNLMWACLPVAAIAVVSSIVGFAAGVSWLAYLGLGFVASSVVGMTTNFALACRNFYKEEDCKDEIHRKQLTESIKKFTRSETKDIAKTNELKQKQEMESLLRKMTNEKEDDFKL